MDQFLLPRQFQQGITHPSESSGSMFAENSENSLKTYESENCFIGFIVLLYCIVLASLAPERQLLCC